MTSFSKSGLPGRLVQADATMLLAAFLKSRVCIRDHAHVSFRLPSPRLPSVLPLHMPESALPQISALPICQGCSTGRDCALLPRATAARAAAFFAGLVTSAKATADLAVDSWGCSPSHEAGKRRSRNCTVVVICMIYQTHSLPGEAISRVKDDTLRPRKVQECSLLRDATAV